MAQVSRQFIKPAVKQKIHRLLLECISDCRDVDTAAKFVDDLLSPTEKVMIAKRISIALMDLKGYSPQEIEETLKVSLPTIYKVKTWLDKKGSGYWALLEKVVERDYKQLKKHKQAKWEAEETTPRRRTNWKAVKREQWKRVKETEVPF